ncbi:cupin [Macrococcus brunensis]|uniref:Cupin n=1 Tax=Macrococcus brunensis TaxID=198483 RepID=A0A4R6BF90_9STAP|nr:cupin [Macrococcus brunensis]TDL98521.1 cupin [Macrococcus brunensis]
MKIFDLDKTNAIKVDNYNSLGFYINRITSIDSKVMINFAHLEPNGIIGSHKASVNQMLIVVSGAGWVKSDNNPFIPITKNQVIFFNAGELHETKSDNGMTALIIESPDLKDDFLV